MSFSADVNIGQAIKCVSDALRLDSDNRVKDAYVHYLRSVHFIVQVLLQDVNAAMSVSMNTMKLVQMGQQCLERISVRLQSLPRSPGGASISYSTLQSPGGASIPHSVPQSPGGAERHVLPSKSSKPLSPGGIAPNFQQRPPSTSEQIRRTNTGGCSTSVGRVVGGPIQEAERKNHKLMVAYRARTARAQNTRHTHETASLNLSMQRRLAENMAVARAREKALTKRLEERQRRLEEEAARRFESLNQTAEEKLERQTFYAEILKYEEHVKWLKSWRDRLKMYPDDTTLIQQLVQAILSSSDHPLSQLLIHYQSDILHRLRSLITNYMASDDDAKQAADIITTPYEQTAGHHMTSTCCEPEPEKGDLAQTNSIVTELTDSRLSSQTEASPAEEMVVVPPYGGNTEENIAVSFGGNTEENIVVPPFGGNTTKVSIDIRKELRAVTQEMHRFLHRLLLMFAVAYEQLEGMVAGDLVYDGIEETFFTPVWRDLIALYRLASKDDERTLDSVMASYDAPLSPEDLSVAPKFSLQPTAPSGGSYPYEVAVNELRLMTQLSSPLNKLACLVRVSHLICHCINEHYLGEGQTNAPKIGADDLIPILSFVIVKSTMPQLVSECRALEEFIHEGYLNGEEGYCLTSLQTALAYMATLAP